MLWEEWDPLDLEWMVGYGAKVTMCLCEAKVLNLCPSEGGEDDCRQNSASICTVRRLI